MSHFQIIELDTVDSTNNYAMLLIDANKAQHGLTITSRSQDAGKGQRGKTWLDTPGQSLLMSIIAVPRRPISAQFAFNASVAVAIANVLQKYLPSAAVHIKWPNDIIVNDKKAGGILIENILRGSTWTHAVIGLGLNVEQAIFPPELPFATSLKIATGKNFDMAKLRNDIYDAIMNEMDVPRPAETIMNVYNGCLYKKGQKQNFVDGGKKLQAIILDANTDGTLRAQLQDGAIVSWHHGQVTWDWGN